METHKVHELRREQERELLRSELLECWEETFFEPRHARYRQRRPEAHLMRKGLGDIHRGARLPTPCAITVYMYKELGAVELRMKTRPRERARSCFLVLLSFRFTATRPSGRLWVPQLDTPPPAPTAGCCAALMPGC